MSRLGKRIKQARIDNYMAQIDVAIKADIGSYKVSMLERGHVPMYLHCLPEIADAIKVPVSELRSLYETDRNEELNDAVVEVRRTPEMERAWQIWKGAQ